MVHTQDPAAEAGPIRSAVDAFNLGDLDGYLSHFAPSCRRWVAGFEDPLSLVEVGGNMRQLVAAFEPLRLYELLLMTQSDFVCVRWQRLVAPSGLTTLASPLVAVTSTSPSPGYTRSPMGVSDVWTYQDPGKCSRQTALGRSAQGNQ